MAFDDDASEMLHQLLLDSVLEPPYKLTAGQNVAFHSFHHLLLRSSGGKAQFCIESVQIKDVMVS